MGEKINQIRKANALSFMMFAYFKIANAGNCDDVINAAINSAYRDAASHVLSFKNDDKKEKRNKAKETARNTLIKSINELRECQKDYNEWHKALCESLVEIYKKDYDYNKGYEFTCGIAQKWVNMLMKYLYVIYYFCKACGYENSSFVSEYGEMIKKYVSDFHVPIDSIIINAAKKDLLIPVGFQSWSKISDYDVYSKFEEEIKKHFKDNLTPIDWECEAWIQNSLKTEKPKNE